MFSAVARRGEPGSDRDRKQFLRVDRAVYNERFLSGQLH